MRPQACLQMLITVHPIMLYIQRDKDSWSSSPIFSHYVKAGKLSRMRRRVYQAIDYQNPEAFRGLDLIEVVHSINVGVVCLISA